MCVREMGRFMRTFKLILYGRKITNFIKPVWSSLHSELKAHVQPLLEENNKECKMDVHSHHTHTKSTIKIGMYGVVFQNNC